ncbi:hypothetical protein [Acrocarpospora corrugata]|nr:hypothetical protein [Acrocarpospora corrugata]
MVTHLEACPLCTECGPELIASLVDEGLPTAELDDAITIAHDPEWRQPGRQLLGAGDDARPAPNPLPWPTENAS